MKKRKDEFSYSNSKYSINFSKDNLKDNKSRFEFLYENSSIHDKKLDLVRAKKYFHLQERMTPNISQRAKNINRPKELFYKRLYTPNNEISTEVSKIKNTNKESKIKFEKENEKNNSISVELSKSEKEKNKVSKDWESLYISNNKKKNQEFKKFYNNNNTNIKSRNNSFLFKPKINNKSKLIASKMKTKSTERLLSLSWKQRENLKTIFQKKRKENEINLKYEEERKNIKKNNNTYKPNVKNNQRKYIDKLYEKGINSIKRKEEEIKKEQSLNEKEYLQYSFTPMINRNYSYSFFNKSNNISMDSYNEKNYPNRFYRNISNLNRKYTNDSKLNKTSVYERNKNWKKIIEHKTAELRKKIYNENSFINDQSNMNIKHSNEILKTDVTFIGKNFIEYQTFLDKYNHKLIKKNLDRINYRKKNIPPKKIYAKKLVVEFVNECDSKCPSNSGTYKFYCDKRPIDEINKNRDKLKISDFFQDELKLESKNFNNFDKEYIIPANNIQREKERERSSEIIPKKSKNYQKNLSFFNAVNSLINKIG